MKLKLDSNVRIQGLRDQQQEYFPSFFQIDDKNTPLANFSKVTPSPDLPGSQNDNQDSKSEET